jgi:hypothetical protein
MNTIDLKTIYIPSKNVVSREIEGEIIIVPLVAGIGDAEDDIFSLNETGRAIWKLLDGKRSLSQVVAVLQEGYDTEKEEIARDVIGLITELEKRQMIIKTGSE